MRWLAARPTALAKKNAAGRKAGSGDNKGQRSFLRVIMDERLKTNLAA
jgi:hypothetical protein